MQRSRWIIVALVSALSATLPTAELWVGAASRDITPARPVALDGQRNVRISKQPETPLSATALAQTFVIQLTGSAGYLPSERAVRGSGYGAVIQSSRVEPDGGQVLVERTVEAFRQLWAKE